MVDLDRLYAALRQAGMLDVPERFGIAPVHQEIPRAVIAEIDAFVRLFDRITTREAWQTAATAIEPHRERCFFSAWDFHLPPGAPEAWQLIEFNDNGSGLLFAAILNRQYYELSGLDRVELPETYASFSERLTGVLRAEIESFFGAPLPGLVLVVDDSPSLESGRFRNELGLLCDLCRAAGWRSELATPEETSWNGARLLFRGEPVAFVVNRSTDFAWETPECAALRAAFASRSVYVVPNPFTYATRSDKRLLEWLSTPARDAELGILPAEREVLAAHVPETHVVREDNVDALARAREDFFFKPSHGFASHGLLTSAQIGRARLRRLLKKGESYVAQRSAPKTRLETRDGTSLWADLRVWAHRGERFMLSGRASRRADGLDLSPPGGWLATYVA